MNLTSFKKAAVFSFNRGSLIARRYSPEILLGVGMVGGLVTVVMACNATLKSQSVIATAKANLATIKEAEKYPDKYSLEDRQKDLATTYSKAGFELIKLYGPAVTLGVASGVCILASRNILNKRNVALVAAYKAVEQSFADYRGRVVERLGAEGEREVRQAITKKTVVTEEIDSETGKKKKVKTIRDEFDPNKVSKYARFFDDTCEHWDPNPQYNRMYLQNKQNWANDLLHARGHLFLNEVYEMLGYDHTSDGAVVGWILTKDGSTDNFVDFGIFEGDRPANRDFVNGKTATVLLDFNVDGLIYDKI